MNNREITLRYGMNPHQKPARIFSKTGTLPIRVLNGSPGYINMLDALNSWQLVKELKLALKLPAAASFKHVSPAGAAVGIPLSDTLKKSYMLEDREITPLAAAYARARGADRVSSFGDWIALSETVDECTAKLIRTEISDGIIAPAYEPEALEILKSKQKGKYRIIQIDPDYDPGELETREVYGITFEQRRNILNIDGEMPGNVATRKKTIPEDAGRDLILAMLALKYTQSNSVCFALDGQVIGCGAGQQSRIHCTRLAASKADIWFLRQHPYVLSMEFRKGVARYHKDNAIDLYLREDITPAEKEKWQDLFEKLPPEFTPEEKEKWLEGLKNVSLASDAFFPFSDNIDRAHKSGVSYIAQPGGSVRDDAVIDACDRYGMVMAITGTRLFHH